MKCRKCRVEIPEASKFCLACGAKQDIQQKPKNRGNGQGSVYQLPNKSWAAVRTIRYEADASGKVRRITRSKHGFKTKKEALEYLPLLTQAEGPKTVTFKQLYDAWEPTHRAGHSTMNCYRAAIKYFMPVWLMKLTDITIDDLQECVDDCPKGKRTRENMKALCGLLYKHAIPRHLCTLNMGPYLIVGGGEAGTKAALPDAAVRALESSVGIISGADYILCQCYLGFRPSEFLALDVADYDRAERTFVGGAKTEAGRNRVVTISPKIQPIIDRLTAGRSSGPVFCNKDGGPLSIAAYRDMFYRTLTACGIDNPTENCDGIQRRQYTPHSCRHTFATMMKRVQAADKDKLALIGHTSTEMLRHYQDVDLTDLRRITDAL